MQSIGHRKIAFLIFVNDMIAPSFPLLTIVFGAPVSLLTENVNLKFMVLISKLNQYL